MDFGAVSEVKIEVVIIIQNLERVIGSQLKRLEECLQFLFLLFFSQIRRSVPHTQNLLKSVRLPPEATSDNALNQDDDAQEIRSNSTPDLNSSLKHALDVFVSSALVMQQTEQQVETDNLNIKLAFKFPTHMTITDINGDVIQLSPPSCP